MSARVADLRAPSAEQQPSADPRGRSDLEVLARVISHDFQEPLRMVSSYLALLDEGFGTEPEAACRMYLATARQGAARLCEMQRALQEYSRLLRMDVVPVESVPLTQIVSHLRAKLRGVLDATGGALEASELPAVVAAPSLLANALERVLDNAMKFRRDLPLRVVISAVRAGDDCIISVADNGVGVDAQWRERAFELFQRLHPVAGLGGVGAGLAIARLAIERQGGRIWLEPGETGGTTVKVRLPASALDQ